MKTLIISIIYLLCAPLIGGLLAGIDRKITARMQSRVGPPILQPFFDVIKLFEKENLVVRRSQNLYIYFFFIFVLYTGCLFFTGGDFLLVIFALTLAGIFFVLGGFKASSPYSYVGSHRELIQMMSYEPAVLLSAIGMYMVTRSFNVSDIVQYNRPLAIYLPGLLFGFLFILAMKFRKSPFDLSTSHHGHQEIVKGITTEFSGKALAFIEIAHWYENVFVLGVVYLFFASHVVVGVLAALVSFIMVILIDNTFARVKWQLALKSSWLVAFTCCLGNLFLLFFVMRK